MLNSGVSKPLISHGDPSSESLPVLFLGSSLDPCTACVPYSYSTTEYTSSKVSPIFSTRCHSARGIENDHLADRQMNSTSASTIREMACVGHAKHCDSILGAAFHLLANLNEQPHVSNNSLINPFRTGDQLATASLALPSSTAI